MRPSQRLFSHASRKPLSSKHANKDYYKGSRVAHLPGGHRTGAPGKHTRLGGYEIDDEKVRVFIAPSLSVLNESRLKPYVYSKVRKPTENTAPSLPLTPNGIDGGLYARIIEEQSSRGESRPASQPASSPEQSS